MEDKPKPLYKKTCPVCHKPFESESRNTKYCNDPACAEFAQKKVGKLRKRRRNRDLNRQFHLEWTRRHRADRDAYLASHKIAMCSECGRERLNLISEHLSNTMMMLDLSETLDEDQVERARSMVARSLELMQDFREKSLVLLKDFEVHHLDGDFRNDDPENHVGLCDVCHKKAESALKKAGESTDGEPFKEEGSVEVPYQVPVKVGDTVTTPWGVGTVIPPASEGEGLGIFIDGGHGVARIDLNPDGKVTEKQ